MQQPLAPPWSVNCLLQCLWGSSGWGHFPALFGIRRRCLWPRNCYLTVRDFFFFCFSFLLLPKFTTVRLPTLDNKLPFYGSLNFFQGKPRPEQPAVAAALLSPAPSPLLIGSGAQGRSRKESGAASMHTRYCKNRVVCRESCSLPSPKSLPF